ncbi:type IV secretion system protein [Sphingomonas sp. ASV193]|uniref:virB8 family protein n=1 Tax=Sphingomonas sp. ASV193 TaxID=3144405 RepID=UPI0032E86BD3
MTKVAKPLDGYFEQAATWAEDRQIEIEKSRRLAWRVALGAAFLAGLEGIALVLMMPLKTVVPYTLLVDKQTGYVTTLDPTKPVTMTADSALTQSLLAQYVVARETFDVTTVKSDYAKVTALSSGAARTTYLAAMSPDSPTNPFRLYPRTSVVSVEIRSVSPLSKDSALVRFATLRQDEGAAAPIAQPYAAVVKFGYSGAPESLAQRLVNPLGFTVTSYRRDPEAPLSPSVITSTNVVGAVPVATIPVTVVPTPTPSPGRAR